MDWGLANVVGLDPARDPDLNNLMGNQAFQELLQTLRQRQNGGAGAGGGSGGPVQPAQAVGLSSPMGLNDSLGAQSWTPAVSQPSLLLLR